MWDLDHVADLDESQPAVMMWPVVGLDDLDSAVLFLLELLERVQNGQPFRFWPFFLLLQ